jgi:hypothetical protein
MSRDLLLGNGHHGRMKTVTDTRSSPAVTGKSTRFRAAPRTTAECCSNNYPAVEKSEVLMNRFLWAILGVVGMMVGSSNAWADYQLGITTKPTANFGPGGLRILKIDPNGAAATQFHLRVNDVIISLNGTMVTSNADLYNALQASKGNVTLVYWPNGDSSLSTTVPGTLTDSGEGTAAQKGSQPKKEKVPPPAKPPVQKTKAASK